jgi:hypothetical protein
LPRDAFSTVMPGLVPGIHVFRVASATAFAARAAPPPKPAFACTSCEVAAELSAPPMAPTG